MLVCNANTGVSMIQDGTVTSSKIVDGSVTNTDLETPYRMVLGTAITASGTSVDFTGIPSWAKRITVMFNGVSTNGTSVPVIQLGDSGGIENTNYNSNAVGISAVTASVAYTTGFGISDNTAVGAAHSGNFNLSKLSENTYVLSGNTSFYPIGGGSKASVAAGSKTLSATLDRIRITTVNGTDAFDAGTINIMYEG